MSWRDTTRVPLEELQDVGERYAPSVLRNYFLRTEVPHGNVVIPVKEQLTDARRMKRAIGWTVLLSRFSLLAGLVSYSLRGGGILEFSSIFFFIVGFGILVLGEFSLMHNRWNFLSRTDAIFFAFAGLCSRTTLLLDLLVLTLMVKEAAQIAVLATFPWAVLAVDQAVLLYHIFRHPIYMPSKSVQIAAPSDRLPASHSGLHSNVVSAVVCGDFQDFKSKVSLTDIALQSDCLLLHHLLIKVYCSIPVQIEVLRRAAVRNFVLLMAYHLLFLPLKIYFAVGFDASGLVMQSIRWTLLAIAVQGLGLFLFPVHPKKSPTDAADQENND